MYDISQVDKRTHTICFAVDDWGTAIMKLLMVSLCAFLLGKHTIPEELNEGCGAERECYIPSSPRIFV